LKLIILLRARLRKNVSFVVKHIIVITHVQKYENLVPKWHVTVEALPKAHAAVKGLCTGMTVPYTDRTPIFGDSLRNKTCP
jgi:hypothetical protein